jgi:hypothetical protein
LCPLSLEGDVPPIGIVNCALQVNAISNTSDVPNALVMQVPFNGLLG